jgi:cytochrome c oxidase cbb3-type subunit IV
MDLDDVRVMWTLLSFITFLGIAFWAYSGGRRQQFQEAAMLPLDDDSTAALWSNEQGEAR